jgi:hypothetical protein
MVDCSVTQDESQVAQRVEDGVCHGCEKCQRARGGSAIDLEDGETNVGLVASHHVRIIPSGKTARRKLGGGRHTMNDPCTAILYCKLSLSCFSFASRT